MLPLAIAFIKRFTQKFSKSSNLKFHQIKIPSAYKNIPIEWNKSVFNVRELSTAILLDGFPVDGLHIGFQISLIKIIRWIPFEYFAKS